MFEQGFSRGDKLPVLLSGLWSFRPINGRCTKARMALNGSFHNQECLNIDPKTFVVLILGTPHKGTPDLENDNTFTTFPLTIIQATN